MTDLTHSSFLTVVTGRRCFAHLRC